MYESNLLIIKSDSAVFMTDYADSLTFAIVFKFFDTANLFFSKVTTSKEKVMYSTNYILC